MQDFNVQDWANMLFAVGFLLNALLALLTYLKTITFKTKMDHLEKNTNSIKDALVKTTGDAEYAKGMLQGRADMKMENKIR